MALVERRGRAPNGMREYQAPTGMRIALLDSATICVLERARYGLDLIGHRGAMSTGALQQASSGGCLVVTGPLYDTNGPLDRAFGSSFSLHPHRDRSGSGSGHIEGAPRVGASFEAFYDNYRSHGTGVIRHLAYNRSRNQYQILSWQRSPPAEWDVIVTGKALQSSLADTSSQMVGFIALTGNHIVVVQATLNGGQSGDFVREVVAESAAYSGLAIDPSQAIVVDDGISRLVYCDGNELDSAALPPPINIRFVPRGGHPGNNGAILRDVSNSVSTQMTGSTWARGAEVPVDNRNALQRAWDWLWGRR